MAPQDPLAGFYDGLAADYHLIYADWEASVRRQGAALDVLLADRLGAGPADVLDCSCGIGTQAIGLALRGHRVVGSDLSAVAAARARREAAARGAVLPAVAADMRRLPFARGRFDAVVCADNSLPHLLTAEDVRTALGAMRRVLRPGGLLVVSTRPYDELRRTRPTGTPPQVVEAAGVRTTTFQRWHWHEDGEHYDLEMVQESSGPGGVRTEVRRAVYWALAREQLTGLVLGAGFTRPLWAEPAASGFFQPVLTAFAP
ncbi:class I SAM-dependent methyltransferase [Kitasatospora sp. DSM 101779]|uniref:class I SAM-dependent methyltransferase n=1 Tax=Kitasatospora sp. DSM 101779 TaxID=2853165 RepID=UPI0021D93788|nr:class I SAM-dependent methyltransferase [Kitasatospora sp. DSM 101779]